MSSQSLFDLAEKAGFTILEHPSFGKTVYIKKGSLKMNITPELFKLLDLLRKNNDEL